MKTIEEELGKVSLTCNGQWNDRPYEYENRDYQYQH
jgi:hypothetical protein